jgi:hypothetical protein
MIEIEPLLILADPSLLLFDQGCGEVKERRPDVGQLQMGAVTSRPGGSQLTKQKAKTKRTNA